jgi:hypothetical protein
MKKAIFTAIIITLMTIFSSKAQVYSPQLAGFYGVSNIWYPYGFYQGQIYNGVAHGQGTFYFNDGSFYYGSFYNGFWDGAGVLVSRAYGYVSGCFSQGVFLGACQNTYNPYNTNTSVQNVVEKVYEEMPDNEDYTAYDPDGYTITKVDPNTEMGKALLGKYR